MTVSAFALAPSQKRGRAKPETLRESDQSISVHLHGCQVGSWPKRLWEPCGVRDGKPVWASRVRKPEELAQLRSWLRKAMQGPPEELAQRLVACAETPRDDSQRDLTLASVNPQSGNIGSSLQLVPQSNVNGRPPLLPAYSENVNVFDLGQVELATGAITRHGMRLIAADTVAMFGIDSSVDQLKIPSRALIRELIWEYHNPLPSLPRRELSPSYVALPLETEAQKSEPALVRAKRLWFRGLDDWQIAKRIGISPAQLKQLRIPRHSVGACRECVGYYEKQRTPLHLSRCEHYSVTFRLDGVRVRRVLMDAEQYLADLRRVEPKTIRPPLPAWNNSWPRASVAHYLGSRMYGQSTLEGHFGNFMTKPSGAGSFHADYNRAWNGQ